nr:RNA polymerase alpha subunit [Annona muricata]WBF97932.1 RNA polymerase alpha subunit [Annona muricata]
MNTILWHCIEARNVGGSLSYGRFVFSPLFRGQSETLGLALRRILIGETESAQITHVKFRKIRHEFLTTFGIEELVHEIVQNLRSVVFTGKINGIHNGIISARGPGRVTAQDILLPPPLEVVNPSLHIATLTEPVEVLIELQIERSCGYHMRTRRPKNEKEGSYPVNAAFAPVRVATYGVHPFSDGRREMLFFEITTDRSLTAKEALYGALRKLAAFVSPFFKDDDLVSIEDLTLDRNRFPDESSSARAARLFFPCSSGTELDKKTALSLIFLDQLEFPRPLYQELKQEKIHSVWDLLIRLLGWDPWRRRIDLDEDARTKLRNFLREYFPGDIFRIDREWV